MVPGTRLARLAFAILAVIVVLGLVASAMAYPR